MWVAEGVTVVRVVDGRTAIGEFAKIGKTISNCGVTTFCVGKGMQESAII